MVIANWLRGMVCGFLGVVTVAIAVGTTILARPSAGALTTNQRQQFGQNNILFYDPDGGNRCGPSTSYTAKPTADQITWIGDSYSTMGQSAIQSKFPGISFGGSVDDAASTIQACKFVSMDTTCNANPTNPSGFEVLRRVIDTGQLQPYLVFALGTNGGWTSNDIATLKSMLSGTNTKVVLTTLRTRVSDYADSNALLKQLADNDANFYLADWAAAYEPGYFKDDSSTHPTENGGFEKWVEVIYDALPGGSVGILAGNTNEEKIWNYFATAGIPGVSDNPMAIAGIMGNIKQESGFNPFDVYNDYYYGLWQTYEERSGGMFERMRQAGLDRYWKSQNAPQDAVDQAMQIQLDWLVQEDERFKSRAYGFLPNVTKVTQTPEAMAELFDVGVEGATGCETRSNVPRRNSRGQLVGQELRDPYVRNLTSNYFYGCMYWQGANSRADNAREIFDRLAGSSAQTVVASQTVTSAGMTWSDGWLSGMPGLTKQDVSNAADLNETIQPGYSTASGKPNKILLHSTEGTSNGYGAYPAGNKFPAHFIIDLKKKEAYQNLPITNRALASVSSDGSSIQIEIVGYSTPSSASNPYYLQDFGASEWDYLALLLSAIAQETGIPLTTSVDWDINYSNANSVRAINANDFNSNVTGVVGHMHSAPNDTHVDPGNIWPMIAEAISRNPSAAQFTTGALNNPCGVGTTAAGAGNLISGGMTLEQAEAFMQLYVNEAKREQKGALHLDGALVKDGGCTHGTLNNCSAFTQWFLNRYTTLGPEGANLFQGSQAVKNYLAAHPQLIDGGKVPKPYAVMSTGPFSGAAEGWDNHTAIVLGIDVANDKIILGEASCSMSAYGPGAHERVLSKYINAASQYGPTYAYTDAVLKGF